MMKTQSPVFTAVRRRSSGVQVEVMLKKIGMPPKGSTIGNSARNVAAADAGSVRRNVPRAWAEVMGSVKDYRRAAAPLRAFKNDNLKSRPA
ncbi:MAG: hypothetical protein ABR921_18090 [Candidatus Sulfotelmatobacter sp.]